MIRLSDVIGKYAPVAVISMISVGGGGGGDGVVVSLPPDVTGYTMDEVSKHTSKTDCWVVVAGKVLDVTNFLKDHPGGELAILTFAGKDANQEVNMKSGATWYSA